MVIFLAKKINNMTRNCKKNWLEGKTGENMDLSESKKILKVPMSHRNQRITWKKNAIKPPQKITFLGMNAVGWLVDTLRSLLFVHVCRAAYW